MRRGSGKTKKKRKEKFRRKGIRKWKEKEG